ncbi:hypothetical protein GCM10012275_08560 [Longimycelium tulufanense]|uniref:Class II aldolase/adducin N-terminal domain-containing protein n=1 Tax=Longimycelium tulufanense TaxID=907463 RepID=A0A8J3C9L0_9PSEU|nr:class II aldolase/adducin family protein [Longimycelium tulufanense]GGM39932.1 hypothetical protein GCM10012275_08560 [Longimycelium tulufanense]
MTTDAVTTDVEPSDVLAELVELSNWLGEPGRDLAILGEGNTSARLGPGRIAIKASGAGLRQVTAGHFVRLDSHRVLELLGTERVSDRELAAELMAAKLGGEGRPSIEAMLHALAVEVAGAGYVAHTHPVVVNQLLCSNRAEALVKGALFPDQIVVCGRHQALVPYADPGLPLARAVRVQMLRHVAHHGTPPKVIYLRNHGILALGGTAREVRQITEMTVKAARILAGTLAVGEPHYLSEREADRIEGREDEHHRQRVLAEQH